MTTNAERRTLRNQLRLSRDERDYIAGHALNSISKEAHDLWSCTTPTVRAGELIASTCARKIAALSNLLGDIGWERCGDDQDGVPNEGAQGWLLGELFPVAQLRPWLEEWQRQDNDALAEAARLLEVAALDRSLFGEKERALRAEVSDKQLVLGTGALLFARIERWMASREADYVGGVLSPVRPDPPPSPSKDKNGR